MPNGGKAIGLNYARQLVKNYKQNKIGSTLSRGETEAVWFSKEVILDALGLDPNTPVHVTGIRIYLGAYERQDGYPDNPEDQNKITLVLVPTNETEVTYDRGTVSETAYTDIIHDPSVTPSYPSPSDPPIAGKYYNDGQIAPPPPPPAHVSLGL